MSGSMLMPRLKNVEDCVLKFIFKYLALDLTPRLLDFVKIM
jgi:hypothetical protein